tara:strand:+ start:7827 stop:8945 length:1119 start_codon:yes stop_codon:yes gene_type:complete
VASITTDQYFDNVDVLEVRHLRNIDYAFLNLSSSVNVILGLNGAGKSTLCEAFSILFHARSYRPSSAFATLTKENSHGFQVNARLSTSYSSTRIKMSKPLGSSWEVTRDDEDVNRLQSITVLTPLLIMSPDVDNIVDTDPAGRRKVMDWLMFHVEHSYADTHKRYSYALKQRNQLLKSRDASAEEMNSWTQELCNAAEDLNTKRVEILKKVNDFFHKSLFGTPFNGAQLVLDSGWDQSKALSECLEEKRFVERQRKTTLSGPHRADLIIQKQDGTLVKSYLSRGEKKRLSLLINLSFVAYLREVLGKKTILIIDDWHAELDVQGRQMVVDLVQDLGLQVILTTTDVDPEINMPSGSKMFHVEHGEIKSETAY